MMKEKEINDANMTEEQIREKLLKLTTGNDNAQPVVKDSSNNVEKEIEELAKKYNMTNEDVKSSVGGIEAMTYDIKVRKAIELMKNTEKETK